MSATYIAETMSRADIDALPGAVVIEFGTEWCGYCQAAQPLIKPLFAQYSQLKHLKIEDGPGRPLGRSFGIKLWPTLIFMLDGKEKSRLTRPANSAAIKSALAEIDSSAM